jgi:hypothetical protein
MKSPIKYMKIGMNEAQIRKELARKKPEKKRMVKPVRSKLFSSGTQVKKDHL